jgi:hypothetical protein
MVFIRKLIQLPDCMKMSLFSWHHLVITGLIAPGGGEGTKMPSCGLLLRIKQNTRVLVVSTLERSSTFFVARNQTKLKFRTLVAEDNHVNKVFIMTANLASWLYESATVLSTSSDPGLLITLATEKIPRYNRVVLTARRREHTRFKSF